MEHVVTSPGGFKICGAWTQAGFASCIQVKGSSKNDDILFDCGVFERETLTAKFVFITHGHVDHVGAAVQHARAKHLSGNSSTYFVPAEVADHLREAHSLYEKLDGHPFDMKIETITPGEKVQINSQTHVVAFKTVHRVPSQGYAIVKKVYGKILAQYQHLSGPEIGELKRSGVQVRGEDTEAVEVVYTGDTVFEALLLPENVFVFSSPVLIMELTYLDGDKERATGHGHVHIADVIENAAVFQNQAIIFCHISSRYSPSSKVISLLKGQLPGVVADRAFVSLRSFGCRDNLTPLGRVSLEGRDREVGWGWARFSRVDQRSPHGMGSSSSTGQGRRGADVTRGGDEDDDSAGSLKSQQRMQGVPKGGPKVGHEAGHEGGRGMDFEDSKEEWGRGRGGGKMGGGARGRARSEGAGGSGGAGGRVVRVSAELDGDRDASDQVIRLAVSELARKRKKVVATNR